MNEKKQKKLIKWMIKTFYENFDPWDLESIFWKKQNLSLHEYLKKEYPTYTIKECYKELNKLLLEKQLQKNAPENKDILTYHGMIMEWNI